MKRILILLVALFFLVSLVEAQNNKLEIGDKAPMTDVKMKDVSGKMFSLKDVKMGNGVLVLFSSNTCPFVIRWEDRYNELKTWADKHEVGMIVLNSNYQKRQGVDSFEKMKEKAKTEDYKSYYVVDAESKIANAMGGQTTPHVFLFDGDFKLAYKGAIDDSYKNSKLVAQPYAKDAIAQLASGETIKVAETKPVGCSIKRKLEKSH